METTERSVLGKKDEKRLKETKKNVTIITRTGKCATKKDEKLFHIYLHNLKKRK